MSWRVADYAAVFDTRLRRRCLWPKPQPRTKSHTCCFYPTSAYVIHSVTCRRDLQQFLSACLAALTIELVSRYGTRVFALHVAYVTLSLCAEVHKLTLLYGRMWNHAYRRHEILFYCIGFYHIVHSTMVHMSFIMYLVHAIMCFGTHIYHFALIRAIFVDIHHTSNYYVVLMLTLAASETITNVLYYYGDDAFVSGSRITVCFTIIAQINRLQRESDNSSRSGLSKTNGRNKTHEPTSEHPVPVTGPIISNHARSIDIKEAGVVDAAGQRQDNSKAGTLHRVGGGGGTLVSSFSAGLMGTQLLNHMHQERGRTRSGSNVRLIGSAGINEDIQATVPANISEMMPPDLSHQQRQKQQQQRRRQHPMSSSNVASVMVLKMSAPILSDTNVSAYRLVEVGAPVASIQNMQVVAVSSPTTTTTTTTEIATHPSSITT